ncbi:MAG TPA: bifunctional 3-deoxy-7-phosphoheptulonate synthase/chorismate mutase [Chthoniobacterales bacterium]|nr:bifunctional 3-deoxy-7-phosphoheptulonate synthase/chorismate mutase [Chthoniobacterales bacterium]
MSESLQSLRNRLDQLDQRIVEALAERQRMVAEVAELKSDPSLPLQDAQRERDLLNRISALAEAEGLDSYFVQSVYRRILEHSVRFQAARQGPTGNTAILAVAYQGIEGSYSHAAARSHFAASPREVRYYGYPAFAAALDALMRDEVELALLPIENSVVGSITETYDLLSRADLHLVGEEILRVEHCLLGLEQVPLGMIRRIGSHPQALAQCSTFLSALENCRVEMEEDTASAARLVAESGDLSRGAIASEEAGTRYGLQVLKRNVANHKEVFTRFVVIARKPTTADLRLPHKTSLLVTIAHAKGALARGLDALASHGVNLTKLESRPCPERPWQYLFYMDFEGGAHEQNVAEALKELAKHSEGIRILGVYPRSVAGVTNADRYAVVPASKDRAKATAPASTAVEPLPENKSYRLTSRAHRSHDTVVEIGRVRIGGTEPFAIIAGPCSVESREQITTCARSLHVAGIGLLRGGCFKPRTSPYDFQGLGFDGLTMLRDAANAYGLAIVTEVLHPGDVDAIARETDALQIGARNMQNFALLKAVGKMHLPVVLKRGLMSSVDEWLAAAEYIMDEGNHRVILCERGIRTFETATRNTLDLSAVPVVRERTHLPVIVDPSHAAGRRELVAPLARAARAVGANGVMLEFHPDPNQAFSDGRQSLDLEQFAALAAELRAPTANPGESAPKM